MRKIYLLIFFIFFIAIFRITDIKAQNNDCSNTESLNLDAIERCLSEIQQAYDQSINATKPLESELKRMQDQVEGIKNRVIVIENDIAIKKQNIDDGHEDLEERKRVFDRTIFHQYIENHQNNWLANLLSKSLAKDLVQNIAYQKAKANQDKAIITNLALAITDLEEKKNNLESEQKTLALVKSSLDAESAKLEDIIGGAKSYQSTLSSQIASLSAKQQEILGQRLAGLNIPRSAGTGATACVDDRGKDPGFGGTRLAFYTYGVPNRTGLNQYGAWGRAKSGHSEEDILRAYYNDIGFENKDNINIKVQGYGEMPLETYMLGIYEMPDSWTENNLAALKAQVIAARSYALSYTNNGANEICTTQSCQVYKGGNKGGNWEQAVNQTAGKVMTQNGQVIKAWYSSTHGGYILPTSELPGWSSTSWTKKAVDTTTGSAGSFDDLSSNAYDKESPWFYCDWGSRSEYNKTAWMKPDEVADIVNAILLARTDQSTQEKLYQPDKPHPFGGEVWSKDRVKSELSSRNIAPFANVTSASVNVDFGSGRVNNVNITGDAGSQSFSGSEFKDWFNLRAPANIQIVGPLYNVEIE